MNNAEAIIKGITREWEIIGSSLSMTKDGISCNDRWAIMQQKAQIFIAGAGLVGLAAAIELRPRDTLRTLLIPIWGSRSISRPCRQSAHSGRITSVDGNKLTLDFDKAGEKRVLDSSVERG